jgi:hypothetical protein
VLGAEEGTTVGDTVITYDGAPDADVDGLRVTTELGYEVGRIEGDDVTMTDGNALSLADG